MTDTPAWVPPPGPAGPPAGTPAAPPPTAPPSPDGRGRGIVPLRPLRLGEVYDGAFRAVRTNPGPMLAGSAVVALVVAAAQYLPVGLGLDLAFDDLLTGAAPTAGDVTALVAGSLPGLLLSVVAAAVLSGALSLAVADAVVGRRPTAGQLWRRVRSRVLALVGLAVLTAVITGAVVLLCLAPGIALIAVGAVDGSGGLLGTGVALAVVGALAAVAAALYLSTRLFMAAPALVLEGTTVRGALARAWRLTSARFWPVLGTWLLAQLAVGLVSSAVSLPFQVAGQLLPMAVDPEDPTLLLLAALAPLAVGQVLASTVSYPLTAAVTVLLHLDARMRLEGLDPSRTPVTAA